MNTSFKKWAENKKLDEMYGEDPAQEADWEKEDAQALPEPPVAQATRKALSAAQKRRPTAQDGMGQAKSIRDMGSQDRGFHNEINRLMDAAPTNILRRVHAYLVKSMPTQPPVV